MIREILQGDKLHLSCRIYITNNVLLLTSDPFRMFSNVTTSSVIKYNRNLPSVFPSIYKGQSEVIRRKDSDSSSQWHRDVTLRAHICVNQSRELYLLP